MLATWNEGGGRLGEKRGTGEGEPEIHRSRVDSFLVSESVGERSTHKVARISSASLCNFFLKSLSVDYLLCKQGLPPIIIFFLLLEVQLPYDLVWPSVGRS